MWKKLNELKTKENLQKQLIKFRVNKSKPICDNEDGFILIGKGQYEKI